MKIKCCGYNIVVGAKTFDEIFKQIDLSKYSKVIILTEKKIYNLWKDKIDSAVKYDKIIQIENGERMKNLATATKILKKVMEIGADRKSLLINIGGGMITDLGGFVASIYMRGIDYINCPTTLLAMVDASIGGKNGVNFEETKNMIGCFGYPKIVVIDIDFLTTLEPRELTSAYGEIIKHAIIFDKNYFNMLLQYAENNKNFEKIAKQNLLKIIQQSLKIKKYIVEKDFKEQNIRKLLNFGHTIGHAIEALSLSTKTPLLHGEAVAIGMIIEAKIAKQMKMISQNEVEKIANILVKYGFENLINQKFNLKTEDIIKIMQKDKKNKNGKIKMVLPAKIGAGKYNIDVSETQIKEVLLEYCNE